jgi:endonuclease/exonuclease/phosphatase family metal-dependent hydrolase
LPAADAQAVEAVRVMTFNLWVGGEEGKQPLEQSVRVIQAARADIVGLQETRGAEVNGQRPDNGRKIAERLGWQHLDQGGGTAIISRFRIVEATPLKLGARLELPSGRSVYAFNVHFNHTPYQPYQLLDIPYNNAPFIKTAAEAVRFAREARGKEVDRLIPELRAALTTGAPVFLTGDFNEPSHLDWTAAAAQGAACPLAVEWPATKAVADCGLVDAFRSLRTDVCCDHGFTWTPTTRQDDPKDRHDRIDFVFTGGPAEAVEAAVVGEDAKLADIVVAPYPADHRAVLAEVELLPLPTRGYSIPLGDLASRTDLQVVVDREPGQYLGHPTTVLLEDGRTILAVYPKGHGRGAIVLKRSEDGGRTWSERLPVPANWATSQETPTIHRVVDARGTKRLVAFSGLHPIRSALSEDDGRTWSDLRPIGDFGGIVAMASVVKLRGPPGGYAAFFHDDGRYFRAGAEPPQSPVFHVYATRSTDGGLTWGAPEVVTNHPQAHLCEPGAVRSPDKKTLALLLRENSRQRNSFVVFSSDEGKTWSPPRELPAALTGDRHVGAYAPDGRLFITFRDTTRESPTRGDWVAWVGTYDDIARGREGQYRLRLMDNHRAADCAYPGLELLPDGTFVTTTYGHWTPGEAPWIACVRVRLEEVDRLLKR